jgi:hypothetical protein
MNTPVEVLREFVDDTLLPGAINFSTNALLRDALFRMRYFLEVGLHPSLGYTVATRRHLSRR